MSAGRRGGAATTLGEVILSREKETFNARVGRRPDSSKGVKGENVGGGEDRLTPGKKKRGMEGKQAHVRKDRARGVA